MGLFLQTALFPGCDESIARDAVRRMPQPSGEEGQGQQHKGYHREQERHGSNKAYETERRRFCRL